MAIENELKYVLTRFASLEVRLAAVLPFSDIWQGYLNPETRIRRLVDTAGQADYVFTFKRRLPDGTNIEIEKDIAESDFMLLWHGCVEKLAKRRFKFRDGVVAWDVDFFQSEQGTYFALAEAEMPEGMAKPDALPGILAANVALEVARGDSRFNSHKLADEAYARKLAAELGVVA